ncbi:MAG: heme o synthase [Nitriliruptor sp.]|uniref:heme o synthase n=1 Tax=Nitriliruptor sp. TaxID=2448056 RepID=UPI00349FFD9D
MTAITAIRTLPETRGWQVVADHASLTKPRVVELLLVTTIPAMLVAAGGWPGLGLVLATLVGGAAVSGSAHATNMVFDRDIDAAMERTAHRPLPSGRIQPAGALVFAAVLLVGGTALLLVVTGWLAAALTVAAWLWYVGIYTVWLKRRSVQNIVIGGAAGAAPPLIGWAAVTGELAAPAWVLFALVTLWTPTHFWALAVGTGQDYARADVPMLPVVRGPAVAARHGAVYAALTVATALLLPLLGIGGWPLAIATIVLGAWFLARAIALVRDPTPKPAWRLFHGSNAFLGAFSFLVAASAFLG